MGSANTTLSVVVSGDGPFSYRWQFNATNIPNDTVSTVAGGFPIYQGGILIGAYSGDGGPATNASLDNPAGMAADASGNIFVSDGYGNSYGHPHPDVLARLGEHGAMVFRTDMDGLVSIRSDGRRLFTDTGLHQPPPAASLYGIF